jgi:hypothetical protein
MVGTTNSLDPESYPDLKKPTSQFAQIIGKKNAYTWTTFTMPENRFCWSAQLQLAAIEFGKIKKAQDSQWGSDSIEPMIKEIYDFKTPYGILGQFIEATPRDRISKVYLEDKFFETWNYGRAVLIGDGKGKWF